MTVNQSRFGKVDEMSLNSVAFAYVPTGCKGGAALCALHVHFHGCKQTTDDIGTTYALHAGLNEWAESNNIIVLYPQAIKSSLFPYNPQGCFDWWGYTTGDYSVRAGPQMVLVRNMVQALVEGQL